MKNFAAILFSALYSLAVVFVSQPRGPVSEPSTTAVEPVQRTRNTRVPVPAVVMAPETGWTTRAVVTRVIDGDTLEVETRKVLRIRLLDCWAPESRIDPRIPEDEQLEEKERGLRSKERLEEIAGGKEVIVHIPLDGDLSQVITMGRLLGRVWLADDPTESLSEKQVRGGYATKTKPEYLK